MFNIRNNYYRLHVLYPLLMHCTTTCHFHVIKIYFMPYQLNCCTYQISRIQNGEINKLSLIDVVEPHFKFSLDDPHFVAGAILVSNCICTFDNSFMELSVSVNSFNVGKQY